MSDEQTSAFDRVDAIIDALDAFIDVLDQIIPELKEGKARDDLTGLRSIVGYLSITHAQIKALAKEKTP